MRKTCPDCGTLLTRDEDEPFSFCEECNQDEQDEKEADDVTKDMSPMGAMLFNCFRSSDPMQQIKALSALEDKLQSRER